MQSELALVNRSFRQSSEEESHNATSLKDIEEEYQNNKSLEDTESLMNKAWYKRLIKSLFNRPIRGRVRFPSSESKGDIPPKLKSRIEKHVKSDVKVHF